MGAAGRRFRFGVTVRSASSRLDWIAIARKAEDLGFSVLAMPDHLGEGRFAIAPGLVLAAEATRQLRVASYVYANDFRNPVFLAQEVATIDQLTGGRFEFGLGAGWLLSDYAQSGLVFDPGGMRVSRMQEGLALIRRLLTEPTVTFSGSHYQVTQAQGFKATQQPHPPFLIGGGGRRILSFAARQASIISVLPRSRADGQGFDVTDASAAAFDQKVAWIREAAGERLGQLELNVLLQAVIPTNDRLETAGMLARQFGVETEGILQTPLVLIGPFDQMVDDLKARRDRYGISYVTVLERDMDAAAPLVSRLAGR